MRKIMIHSCSITGLIDYEKTVKGIEKLMSVENISNLTEKEIDEINRDRVNIDIAHSLNKIAELLESITEPRDTEDTHND